MVGVALVTVAEVAVPGAQRVGVNSIAVGGSH